MVQLQVGVVAGSNAFLMLLLQQGSPAQRCIPRIGVGDRILAINGNQASNF